MKSTLTKEQYKRIYDLLNSCELLDYDCGKLCNAACCTVSREYSEDDMGIYFLPGEEQLLEEEDKKWLDIRISQAEDHDLPESAARLRRFVLERRDPSSAGPFLWLPT